jgi:DNA polymerase-3 subunit epsilon
MPLKERLPMESRRVIFYDTETTGLKAEKDRIVEIAAYIPAEDKTFVELVNPGCPIPEEASAIHKITDSMVADSPSFSGVGPEFLKFCGENAVLIAHNNDAFDIHFLRAEYSRINLSLPPWAFVDSLKWARRYRKDLPRHTLQFLREILGIEANTAHRALDDVIILHKVFQELTGDLSIDQVISLLSGQTKEFPPNVMPFGKHQGKPLATLPSDYVAWMKKNGVFEKPENQALKQELEKLGKLAG